MGKTTGEDVFVLRASYKTAMKIREDTSYCCSRFTVGGTRRSTWCYWTTYSIGGSLKSFASFPRDGFLLLPLGVTHVCVYEFTVWWFYLYGRCGRDRHHGPTQQEMCCSTAVVIVIGVYEMYRGLVL